VVKIHHADGKISTVFYFALLHMPNYCMQRNGSSRYPHAYFASPSADADDVIKISSEIEHPF
jgi:hypothetical protein